MSVIVISFYTFTNWRQGSLGGFGKVIFIVILSCFIVLVTSKKDTKYKIDNSANEVIKDCLFDGKLYKPGERIDSKDKCIK